MQIELEKIDAELGSPDEDTRWQAGIALGEYCEDAPEVIWPLTVKWGSSEDADVRMAIGTCVLEHILEYHFHEYFQKTAKIVRGGNRNFGATFECCWKFGNAKIVENNKRWNQLETFLDWYDKTSQSKSKTSRT